MTSMKRCLAGLLIVPMAILCRPAMADVDPTARDVRYVESARASMRQGDLKTALIQLKKAVKENPSNGEARFELGVLEFRMRDFIAAEKELTQARANNYDLGKVNPILATTLLAQGKFQQMIDMVEPCPNDRECKGEVLALRSRARLGLKDIDAADKDSLEALEALPEGVSSRLARALVLRAEGKNSEAKALVDALLKTNPRQPDALTLRAELLRQNNDLKDAIASFKQALDISPKDLNTHLQLALTLMADNNDEEASREVNLVLASVPKAPMALYVKGVLLARAHKMVQALETVRPVEPAIAEIPRGVFLLALIHAENNDLEQALDYARRFHIAQPENIVGAKLLANIEFRQRAFDKVIATLAPLRNQLANDPDALSVLGSAYLAEGQIKDANELLTEAVKVRPDDPLARARLAVSQSRQDSTRDAGIRELESLVKADPGNKTIDLALLSTYIAGGQYDKAIDAATAMARHMPKSPLPLVVRGSAQLAKGDDKEARKDFDQALTIDPNFVPAAVYISEMDMRAGDFAHARSLLDDMLQRNASDLRLLMARSQVEMRNGKTADAMPFLEAAVKAHPGETDPQIQLIRAEIDTGNTEKAIIDAEDLAQKNRNDPAVVDVAAHALLILGRANDSIDLYRQLETDFPESAPLHTRAGEIMTSLGKRDEARTAFERAISANPHFVRAWIDRAMLELKINGVEAAQAIAAKAQAENPKEEALSLLPTDILSEAGRLAEAEKSYSEIAAKAPTPAVLVRLIQTVDKRGDHRRAISLASDWLKSHPDDFDVRMMLAEKELASGDVKAAAADYEALAAKQPRNAAILNNLAWAYERAKDPRAVSTAERAYQAAPGMADVIDTYAAILYRHGNTKRGAELQRQAYTASPRNPQIAYHMARVLADAKETGEARNILKPIIESKRPFDESDDARALYATLGGS